MEPIKLAGHVSAGELHNDVYVVGPTQTGYGTGVRIFLTNGYGISVATSSYVRR